MCLRIRYDAEAGESLVLIAEQDITVYKVLRKRWFGVYKTPAQGMRIFNPQPGTVLTPKENTFQITDDYYGRKTLFGGAIHVCTDIRWALNVFDDYKSEIFECVIPAGTDYCRGYTWEAAAREVRIVRHIPRQEAFQIAKALTLSERRNSGLTDASRRRRAKTLKKKRLVRKKHK